MDTGRLKTFAQAARRQLLEQVSTRLEQVLRSDSVETREKKAAIAELRQQIDQASRQVVIDRVAYTWFNRFCALRFMDVNRYTRLGIVSPVEGYTQAEILQEAKQGVIDAEFKVDRQRVLHILSGKIPSTDPQGEAYRLLLVGACNAYHQLMPFLFEPIADSTELLMPDDLLSENSILHKLRQELTVETCQDVEVIGWLYQFYISERKDEVFENLKKNIKIEAKDIPAATQLFTPHWIVRYLVENSLGRLWMLNHPNSKLIEQMEYYIKPEKEEADYLHIASPEEIKVCDPACGSGHMLTYAFDLLYTIYEEQGYDPTQIPCLILQKNLYGIEIDKRAGDLAAFALVMKARAKDRRFFSRKVEPNICVLQNVSFTDKELNEYMDAISRDLFTEPLRMTLKQFEQADNFGSLIQPQLKDVTYVRSRLEEKKVFENLFLHNTNQKVQQVLKQAEYLFPRYHVVVANPPYMGKRGANEELREFSIGNYPSTNFDLFAMFIERGFEFVITYGYNAMVTMQSWMFLSTYEPLRTKLLNNTTIKCMVHMASMVMGIAFGTTATVWQNFYVEKYKGHFTYVNYEDINDKNEPTEFPVKNSRLALASSEDFKKIPGSPIAYWVKDTLRESFQNNKMAKYATLFQGIITGNNNKFVRYWFELNFNKIALHKSDINKIDVAKTYWIPYNKGGESRNWYGNHEYVVNFRNKGRDFTRGKHQFSKYFLKPCFSWTYISSSSFAARYFPNGFIWDVAGSSVFPTDKNLLFFFLSLIASKVGIYLLDIINPTYNFQVENIAAIPVIFPSQDDINIVQQSAEENINIAKYDWDSQERSWDFNYSPIYKSNEVKSSVERTYRSLHSSWEEMTIIMKSREEIINKIFIGAYQLENELMPDVNIDRVTLRLNSNYRYSGESTENEKEKFLLADMMKEFISYAVGCMFGRYSLDKPGLILANQGETAQDYYWQILQPSFPPDEDNVIPVLEAGWFNDDITERFKKFLRITYGDEHYEENLAFIENAIGRDIRSYSLKDFYSEHVHMYKNRPIYWLFSSPGGSFNALIYMHRYRPDTVSVVLNDYLREYVRKLNAHKAHLEQVSLRMGGSQAEKTKATKEINALNKVLAELKEYEDDVLYPLATRQIQIDLDDGVKVNYNKFGKALKWVKGLSE